MKKKYGIFSFSVFFLKHMVNNKTLYTELNFRETVSFMHGPLTANVSLGPRQ